MKQCVFLFLFLMFCYSSGNTADDLQNKSVYGFRLVDEILLDFPPLGIECKKQLKNGVYKRYYNDGVLYQEVNCQDKMLDGRFRQYHPDGALAVRAYYYHDQLEGNFEKYFKNGNQWEIKKYKSGQLNGMLLLEERYVKGKPQDNPIQYLVSKQQFIKDSEKANDGMAIIDGSNPFGFVFRAGGVGATGL